MNAARRQDLLRAAAGAVLAVGVGAPFVRAAALDLRVVDEASGAASISVAAGDTVRYQVVAELAAGDGQGLASLVLDLEFDGGPVPPTDPPAGSPMDHFLPSHGVSLNPAGFCGTPMGSVLLQVGGAQNWLGHGAWPCAGDADCPGGGACAQGVCAPVAGLGVGEVVLGVAAPGAPEVVARGGLTAPSEPGTYVLTVRNLRATQFAPATAGGPWWDLVAVEAGAVDGLQIQVAQMQQAAVPTLSRAGAAVLAALLATAGVLGILRRR